MKQQQQQQQKENQNPRRGFHKSRDGSVHTIFPQKGHHFCEAKGLAVSHGVR